MELTEGALLAGRVRYWQAQDGYRTGIEPVLLAATCPARPGERVLELGTGAGAALLCLAARVPGVRGVGVELDPGLAALARRNLAANGMDGILVREADAAGLTADEAFDHAISNPPWHGAASTPSPVPGRRRAKQAGTGLLAAWCEAAARALRPGGTFTLALPAALAGEAFAALAGAGLGAPALFPLWPREGRPARLVLLQARRGARGPARVLPGAALHAGAGWSAWADGVLRDGAAVVMADGPSSAARGLPLRCRDSKEGTMVVVSVLYPASDGEDFNHDYYMTSHIPLVRKRWASMGLHDVEVLRGVPGPDGTKPAFNAMALLRFESLDAFKAAAGAHGAELFGDIPNFTNAKPTVQFNSVGAG